MDAEDVADDDQQRECEEESARISDIESTEPNHAHMMAEKA